MTSESKKPLAVITGGGTGLGLATGLELASRGFRVIAVGLDQEPELAGSKIAFHQLDIVDEAAMRELYGALGEIDVLINAAGVIRHGGAEFEMAGFRQVVDINLNGTHLSCLLAKDALAKTKGSIVNFASMWSYFGSPRNPAYSASKGGVASLTRALAVAYAADGIRVNAIAPGWIETRMSSAALNDPQRSVEIMKRLPTKFWGQPADIAKAAAFLVSADARYITGVTLPVDGGFSIA